MVAFIVSILYSIHAVGTDVKLTRHKRVLLPLVAAFLVNLFPIGAAFAQENPEANQSVELETGNLAIKENPIYERLIEAINFLSVGVTVVIAISIAIAGYQYITSRGDPSRTSAAVNRIVQAGTAMLLYVFGWSILNWMIPGGVLN